MMGLWPLPVTSRQSATRLTVGNIPDSFDARKAFAQCQKPVRNQAACGSCWAFGAAETLTDNLCVLGSNPPALSAQDLVSCDSQDHGCKGGSLLNAWSFIDSNGLASEGCMPYVSGKSPGNTSVPICTDAQCQKFTCPVKHSMLDSDQDIQAAVMIVGAVEVGFTVYEDFMNYKSGVYKYSEGVALGGHAVKIVGWGKDLSSTFYWIVQNSWGKSWGESGFFRIVNWHDDKDSAIAIGGGFACVQGKLPTPPTPAPTPAPCKDIVSYCGNYGREKCASTSYIVPVCQKTCGCCDNLLKPSYCNSSTSELLMV